MRQMHPFNRQKMKWKTKNDENRLKTNYKWEIVRIKKELGGVMELSVGRDVSRAFIKIEESPMSVGLHHLLSKVKLCI